MSKTLIKYISSFDYFNKSLIALPVTTGSISIASFATVIGAPAGIVRTSLSHVCSIFTGLVKKNVNNNKK